MKILIDARFYGLEHAGLGRYTTNLLTGLQQIDKKNSFVVLLRDKYFNELKFPDNWSKVKTEFRHYSIKEQMVLPNLIKKEKPDLVHFPHFNVPLFYKGPYVVTIHDLLMHKQKGKDATTLPLYAYFIKRLGYKGVFRRAVKGAKAIIVPSASVKKELISYYKIKKDKVFVIYEGVSLMSPAKFSSAEVLKKYNLKSPYFIYTGNAYPHKNLERAIMAVSGLGKSVSLAIVSSRNVFTQRLEVLISKHHAEGKIKLLGFVPDDELSHLYRSSVGFLYPSLSEGFGLPGLEAMSAGTIALVSDIPVFREIYSNKALYFDPLRIEEIKSTLQKALNLEASARMKIVKEGQEFVKKYSWSKMAQETSEIYESCAGIRSGK